MDSIPALGMYVIAVPAGSSALVDLRADPSVVRVDLDRVRDTEATPSDTAFADQWALEKIGWTSVFGTVTPAGTAVVALLDTGVDSSNPDLTGQLVAGTSILDGSAGTTDPNGHGTAMAGIIAALTDNGTGIAGVGYAGVRVMPITVLDAAGLGADSDIIEGIVWAVGHGADVINMSFSNPGYSASLQAAVDYAWARDVVVVAATGNDGSSSVTFPAGDRGVIGVSNTDQADALNTSSNFGADTFLAAPGTDIVATAVGGGTTSITGTSASSAIVAAAAALLRAVDPSASNGVIAGRLARSADPAGTAEQTGNGRLNLGRAVTDTATDIVVPTGAPGGGPFVGPYVAAAQSTISGIVKSFATDLPVSGATVTVTCSTPTCSSTTPTYAGGGSSTNSTGQYSSQPNFSPGSATPTVMVSASAPGYQLVALPTFQVGNGDSYTKDFSLTPVNSAPSATSQSVTTNEDTAKTINLSGSDVDGNVLTFAIVDAPSHGSLGLIGSVTCTGTAPKSCTADVTYTPAANTNGVDSFTFKSNDGTLDSTAAAVVTITVTPVNDAPTISDTADQSTLEDTAKGPISFTVGDVETAADSLLVSATSSNTTLVPNANITLGGSGASRTITLAPAANLSGTTTITVTVSDGSLTASDTFVLTVTPVNDAPLAVGNSYSTNEDTLLNVGAPGILANDSDIDSSSLTATLVDNVGHGALTLHANGSFDYTPAPNYYGSDSFTYKASDGFLDSNVVTVSITVTAVNDAPVCQDQGTAVVEDGTLSSSVTPCSDVEGSSLSYALGSSVTHGTLTLYANGAFTYSPALNYNGSDSFTFTTSDGDLDSNVATLTVTVTSVNDAPVLALIGPKTVDEETTLAITATASDIDGDSLVFSLVGAPTGAAITAGGVFSWTPTETQGPGDYTFDVVVSDGLLSDAETITVTVDEVNVAPVLALIGDQTVAEGSTLSFTTSASDHDLPANGLVFSLIGAPAGAAIDPSTGAFSWTPADNGTATFRVRATDDGTPPLFDEEEITVTVGNVAPTAVLGNDGPVNEGSPTTIAFSAQFDPSPTDITAGFRYAFSCTSGDLAAATWAAAGTSASTSCTFSDGPATQTVKARIIDKDGGYTEYTTDVTVDNVAPTVAFTGGPVLVNEGTAQYTYSYSISDPGVDAVSSVAVSCGTGGTLVGDSATNTDTAGSFKCQFLDGPATPTVTVRATDSDDDAGNTAERAVTVDNVAPTVDPVTVTLDPVTHIATATASFTDPGILDTHTATVTWNVGGTGPIVTLVESGGSGTVTGKITIGAGCYPTLTATVTVTDKDGGGGSRSGTLVGSADAYAASFQAPIKDNERNIAKYGNVVPIKVTLVSSCTGAAITTASLFVTLTPGPNGEYIDTTNIVAESVSAADTLNLMRLNGSGYIYNLTTKGLTPSMDYAVRIRSGSSSGPIILQAVLQPKK